MVTSKVISSWKGLKAPIGIFGGTFDPVQRAHTEIAKRALEQKNLGSVVFVPAKQNPLKKSSPSVTDTHRVEMLSLAIKEEDSFYISTHELQRSLSEPSYTILTVKEVRRECGEQTPIYFIAGGDVLHDLPKWNSINEIFSLLDGFIVVQREKPIYEEIARLKGSLTEHHLQILIRDSLPKESLDISSTDIREDLVAGIDVSNRLHQGVYSYIQAHRLYL